MVRGASARARAISLVQRRRISRAWRTTLPTVLSSKERSRLLTRWARRDEVPLVLNFIKTR
jgi:hypothetical protein